MATRAAANGWFLLQLERRFVHLEQALASSDPSKLDSCQPPSSARLLERAVRGDRSAVDELFARFLPRLRRWTRGRLPRWARDVVDTSDLVQDTLLHAFTRITAFEPKGEGALRAYLRQAVENRIRDELRRVARRPAVHNLDVDIQLPGGERSPLDHAIDEQTWSRYLSALKRLTPRERRLIVGRAELGYSFTQLAHIDGRASPDAARMALKRALVRLASEMGDDDAPSRGKPNG